MSVDAASIRKMIFWPAVITFAITLLRLVGELLNWSPALFNRAAGGGGALIGISWLPPVFGVLFALQLVKMGHGPVTGGRAVVRALLGVVATVAIIAVFSMLKILGDGQFSFAGLLIFTSAIAVGAAVAWSGWPDLGRTLLAYAFAARIPVALVMLVAMIANWGTHYDVAPPGFPEMGVFTKWLLIGALPQFTTWIAITVLFGALFGAIAGWLAMRRRAAPVARPAVA